MDLQRELSWIVIPPFEFVALCCSLNVDQADDVVAQGGDFNVCWSNQSIDFFIDRVSQISRYLVKFDLERPVLTSS